MPRRKSKQAVKPAGPRKTDKSDASIKKIENYEDTLEEDGVDDFMFKRDKIGFGDDDAQSEEEDFITGDGEEVFGLKQRDESDEDEDFDDEEDDEEEEDVAPVKKGRKEKKVEDKSTKGRYGKGDVSSDEDDSEVNTEDEYDQEGWGRQYYSKPSNARAKEGSAELLDERREEDRELEEKEVRRLQRKARESIATAGDWGLDELNEDTEDIVLEEDVQAKPVAVPTSSDPTVLMKHLASQEPVKLALARDFPLIVKRLDKTARGILKMESEADGEGELHKGLGWLHYHTLLTYATTLAFYLHLAALPPATRPDFTTHPIIPRLLQLKEGVAMLEDLDFDAGSVSGDPLVLNNPFGDDDEEDEEEIDLDDIDEDTKAELLARMRKAQGREWEDDAEGLWDEDESLEDGELEGLMEEADEVATVKKSKKTKKAKKSKVSSKESESSSTLPEGYSVLAEPEFVPSSSKRSSSSKAVDNDDHGDPLALSRADAADKSQRKHSLRFHTSKIAATAARRDAARRDRMGGDEDLPYRDLKRGRDDALRKNGPQGSEGEALDGEEWSEKDRKAAREIMDMDVDERDGGEEDAEGYYDLVKRQKRESKDAKKEEYEAARAAERSVFDEVESGSGPRSLTRAIEKNRGLTPHRAKSVRNPRVKKREAYEKAKRKVASQRAVYKGGQAALGGTYQGEKTGISTVTKSRKFGG